MRGAGAIGRRVSAGIRIGHGIGLKRACAAPYGRVLLALFVGAVGVAGSASAAPLAAAVESSGQRDGLLVIVGGGAFDLDDAVGLSRRFVIQCLDTDAGRVRQRREAIQARGLYGQISVEYRAGQDLPYLDNLVNVVVADPATAPATAEAMRVLRPGGAYCVTGAKPQVKPWPAGMGQWTHQWYQPHGNLYTDDRLAGPPTGMQWLMGLPVVLNSARFAGTQSLITEGGRIFFITFNDEENVIHNTQRYFLIARDAFNGLFLWKRPWTETLGRGDLQMTAVSCPKIVAHKERLYIVEGAEILALDAASGVVVQRYACDGVPQVLLYADDKLVVESDKGVSVLDPKGGQALWVYKTRGVPNEAKAEKPRQQWRLETPGIVSTLISHGRLCFLERRRNQDGKGQHDEVVCLDFATGRELWRKTLEDVKVLIDRRGVKICFIDEKVLGLMEENVFTALSTADGRELWSERPGNSSKWWTYHRFAGHFFRDGQIWLHMKDTGYAYDSQEQWSVFEAETGKLVREFTSKGLWPRSSSPGKEGCSQPLVTDKYLVFPRVATFIDLETGEKQHHKFYRGSCVLGIVPANGMFYTPPEACACFSEHVHGFMALSGRAGIERLGPDRTEDRLEKGPAWPAEAAAGAEEGDAWPQYRGNAARGAASASVLWRQDSMPADAQDGRAQEPASTALSELWAAPVASLADCRSRHEWNMRTGNIISAPAIAGGKVFVAVPDSHQMLALDARTGAKIWQFTADGRIDTPPSVFQGLCLFGSRDGRLYCLRASDGALVWRFLAAPNARRMIAHGQPESLWPVISVLIHGGRLFAAAGRAPDADGGVLLTALDPATGKSLWRKTINEGLGGQSDVLTSDEKSLYLLGHEIDPLTGESRRLYDPAGPPDAPETYQLIRTKEAERFLASSHYGLTDATWTRNGLARRKNMQTWRYHGGSGLLMAFAGPGIAGYHNLTVSDLSKDDKSVNRIRYAIGTNTAWIASFSPLMQVDAMALTSDALLASGPVDWKRKADRTGFLHAYSLKDGLQRADVNLPAPPVFDGLAAAYGRVYVAAEDGVLRCFGERRK